MALLRVEATGLRLVQAPGRGLVMGQGFAPEVAAVDEDASEASTNACMDELIRLNIDVSTFFCFCL